MIDNTSLWEMYMTVMNGLRSLSGLEENLHASGSFYFACDLNGQLVTMSSHFTWVLVSCLSILFCSLVSYLTATSETLSGYSLYLSTLFPILSLTLYSSLTFTLTLNNNINNNNYTSNLLISLPPILFVLIFYRWM